MDRRTTIRWMLAAGAAWPALKYRSARADAAAGSHGYGTDPRIVEATRPGEFWPLTLTAAQRRLAGVLADIILPADEHSPAASTVGVVDFLDEWVSAPYPDQQADRPVLLDGFTWLDAESGRRHGKDFADLAAGEQAAICDAICNEASATAALRTPARFFALFRDLASGGFYSSPAGRKDLNYVGNVPLAQFDGPDPQLLRRLGLA